MRIRGIDPNVISLHTAYSKLWKLQSVADLVDNVCVPNRDPWLIRHNTNGYTDGYVTSTGTVKKGFTRIQLRDHYQIENLSLFSKLFPKTAIKSAQKMIVEILENINPTETPISSVDIKRPHRPTKRVAALV